MTGFASDRRGFIKLAAGGLLLGLPAVRAGGATQDTGLAQRFLRIDPNGTVTVFAKHLDMGQGIWTGLATIVAEELDADWARMRVEGAPARMPDYAHNLFGAQTTGGSTSIANSWDELRLAGATARAMLVAAAARLWRVAPAEIAVAAGRVTHADGRSAGFGDLAGLAAAEPMPVDVRLKQPAEYRLIGRPLPRLDVPEKTRGRQRFGIDVRLEGMKTAVVLRAPRFGATLRRFDAASALALPGVAAVVAIPSGVAVIAETSWAAMRARDAIDADWDESRAETRSTADILAGYDAQIDRTPGFTVTRRGDPDRGFARARRIVEARYAFPYLAHAPMEPLAVAGRLGPDGCALTAGFQSQTANQKAVADILGLPIEKVTLETLYAGGSFGRRASFTSDWVVEIAHILKATAGRWPIKLLWTRADDISGGYYRPLNRHRLRAGLDAAGRIIAVDQAIVGQSIFMAPPYGDADLDQPDMLGYLGNLVDHYDIPDARLRWFAPKVRVPVHTFRSISNTHTALSKEIFMDRLARAAGADPIAFRLGYLGHAPRRANVLTLAAQRFGWGRPLAPGRAAGVAVHESEDSFVAQIAEVSMLEGVPLVHRVVCAVDCGLVINPDNVRAQVEGGIGFGLGAALHGEITLSGGRVDQSNFDGYRVLRFDEMPREIEVHIVPSAERPTGIGEPGSVPIGAAVANAIAQLTGREIERFPIASGMAA